MASLCPWPGPARWPARVSVAAQIEPGRADGCADTPADLPMAEIACDGRRPCSADRVQARAVIWPCQPGLERAARKPGISLAPIRYAARGSKCHGKQPKTRKKLISTNPPEPCHESRTQTQTRSLCPGLRGHRGAGPASGSSQPSAGSRGLTHHRVRPGHSIRSGLRAQRRAWQQSMESSGTANPHQGGHAELTGVSNRRWPDRRQKPHGLGCGGDPCRSGHRQGGCVEPRSGPPDSGAPPSPSVSPATLKGSRFGSRLGCRSHIQALLGWLASRADAGRRGTVITAGNSARLTPGPEAEATGHLVHGAAAGMQAMPWSGASPHGFGR